MEEEYLISVEQTTIIILSVLLFFSIIVNIFLGIFFFRIKRSVTSSFIKMSESKRPVLRNGKKAK